MAAISKNLLIAGAAILIISASAAAYTLSRPPIDPTATNNQGGLGASPPSMTPTAPPTTTTTTNSSKSGKGEVLFTFETPIKIFIHEHKIFKEPETLQYWVQGYISWVPENPYIRYYEVTVNFNENNLHAENRYSPAEYMRGGTRLIPSFLTSGRRVISWH